MRRDIIVFGYGIHGRFIARGLQEDAYKVQIVADNDTFLQKAHEDGFDEAKVLDVTRDEALHSLGLKEKDIVVTVMEDEHLNVFLTLSLRALYPTLEIVSISSTTHMAQKLKMAGASKVIDLYEVSANRIHNILNKPIATKLLDSFISKEGEISVREIEVPKGSFLDGELVGGVDFRSEGVILIGMVDKELSERFIFITSGISHKIDASDILVCIGYDNDLSRFERKLRAKERG